MQGVIKKFLDYTLSKYSDGKIEVTVQSSAQGLIQFNTIKQLNLNKEIIKNVCLPVGLESGSVEGLQISVSGKDLINAKFKVKIGSIIVNVVQLPNSHLSKQSIEKLLRSQQTSKIKAFILDLITDKIKESKKVLYQQLLIRILNNLQLSIDKIELGYKRQKDILFEVKLANLTNKENESTRGWKTIKAQKLDIDYQSYKILSLETIQVNRVFKLVNSSEFALFDLDLKFAKANLNIDSLVQIYGIIAKADHSADLISNLQDQNQVAQLKQLEKKQKNQQIKVAKTEKQIQQEKKKIAQKIKDLLEGEGSNDVTLKDIASANFNSFLLAEFDGLLKSTTDKQKIGLGVVDQSERQILKNFNAYANSVSNLPFLRLSIEVKSLEVAIGDGHQITTDFSFSLLQYEEKNILQLKRLQKANHSVINVELKNITGQQKLKENDKQKIATWFIVKQVKINQNRQYAYNSKQDRYTLQKKIKITSFQLDFNSKRGALESWAKAFNSFGQRYTAQQKQLDQARELLDVSGKKQDYISVIKRTPNYLIFDRTQISLQASTINVTLKDESDKQAFKFNFGWGAISAWINRVTFRLSIFGSTLSLQFKNARSLAFQPIIQPFRSNVIFETIQLGSRINESKLSIEAEKKTQQGQLKINASPQLIIAYNNFIGKKISADTTCKKNAKNLVFKNQLNKTVYIRYKKLAQQKEVLQDQTVQQKKKQIENIVSFSLGLSKCKLSKDLFVDSIPYKTIVSVQNKFSLILIREYSDSSTTVIRILPPLLIYNCLPQPISVQFNQGIKTISQKVIDQKGLHLSNTYESVNSLEFKVKVEGYGWSQGLKYNKINDESNVESDFELVDLDKNQIKLNFSLKKNKQTQQYTLLIYCKKYIKHYLSGSVLFQGSLLPDKNHTRGQNKFKSIKGYSNYKGDNGHVVLVGSQVDNQIQLSWHSAPQSKATFNTENITPIFIGGVGKSSFIIQQYRKTQEGEVISQPNLIGLQVNTIQLVKGLNIFTKQIVIRPLKLKFKRNVQKTITIRVFNKAQLTQLILNQQKKQAEIELNAQNKYYITIGSKQNCISLPFGDKILLGQDFILEIQKKKDQKDQNNLVYTFSSQKQKNQSQKIQSNKQQKPSIFSNNLTSVNIESIFFSINFNFDEEVTPYQSLVVTLKRFNFTKHQTEKGIKYGLKLGYFQVDQMYPYNLPNPVILKSSFPQNFLNIIAKANKQKVVTEVAINLPSLDVNFTVETFKLFDSFSREFGFLNQKNQASASEILKKIVGDEIQQVKISPITLRLSAQADINKINLQNNLFINILMSSVGAIKNNANRVPIHITGLQLKGFKVSNFLTPLISHYQNICASQFYQQFRGIVMRGERLNNLGDICCSYRNITDITELELEVFREKLDKPKVENEESGIFTFISQSTDKISDGLAFLTFDKEYKEQRNKELSKQPQTALQGLEQGGKALWNGFEEGFTGIFTQPYRGARQEGVIGFVKGVGKGLTGLVVKPITGICDCISSTVQGIGNSLDDQVPENLKTMRYPRVLYTNKHILRQYSRQDSKLYYIINEAYSLQKQPPILYGAYQYSGSELLAFLQLSIVLVDLNQQKVDDQIKYSQLEVKVDASNKTLTFKKKGSSPLGCQGCNQYELTIESDIIRQRIADFVTGKVWKN